MVVSNPVRAIVLADFSEQQVGTRCEPGAGDTACGGYGNRRVVLKQIRANQRKKSEEDCRGITSWVRDDVGTSDSVPVDLRQSVRNAGDTGKFALVAGTQVGRQVDDFRTRSMCATHPLQRCAMRQGAEDQIRIAKRCVFRRDKSEFGTTYADGLSALAMRSGKTQLQLRVALHQHAQLTTRVAARSKNPDRKFMHK